jgi:ribonuclease P protein component
MFAQKNRLGTAGFGNKKIKKTTIGPFLVRFGKNNTEENRFAVVVSAKFEKSAVKRHYWQRQIREKLKNWPRAGLDVIVSPLPAAKESGAKKSSETLLDGYKSII